MGWEKEENLCLHPFSMQPPAAQARISQRCAKRGAALMPKWVSQEHPKLFAPVGIGLDGHGGVCNFEDFNLKGIWTPPVDHPNQRGAPVWVAACSGGSPQELLRWCMNHHNSTVF